MMMPNASHPVSTEILNSIYNLFDFYYAFRSKPFPIAALQGMPTAQSEAQEYSGFCYLLDAPEMQSATVDGSFQNVNFSVCEVI